MTTARDIIKKSMLKIGALMKSEQPSADEAVDGLSELNSMVSSWSTDNLTLIARAWETFPLTSGVSLYTIGTGGDFNTTRPIDIISAYVRNGDVDTGLSLITDEAYNEIPYKSQAGIPEFLNYDGGFPLGKVRLYSIPDSTYSLFLLTEKPHTGFATLDTVLDMPSGWEDALVYNLAVRLAPDYQQQITPEINKLANESLSSIRMGVLKNRPMDAYPTKPITNHFLNGWGM